MTELVKVRPYRLGHDTQEACLLEAAAFTEDYRRLGEDPRLESRRERSMERMISWLAPIVPSLRHARLGFVAEMEGRIASIVLFSRDDINGRCWSIEAVGTHPDYQRKGLAKQLLRHVLRTIRDHGGESCTLKVRQDNAAAYRMYHGLGFAHFHTSRQMRCECKGFRGILAIPIDGLEPTSKRSWYALWRERMLLSERSTTSRVQQYKPIVAEDFRKSRLIRVLAPWALKLSGCRLEQWIVRKNGVVVATLRTSADLTGNRSHEIRLVIDPECRSQLAAPLAQIACQQLGNIPAKGALIELDGSEDAVIDALKSVGFKDMSIWHWLGVRVDRAMMCVGEDVQALTA